MARNEVLQRILEARLAGDDLTASPLVNEVVMPIYFHGDYAAAGVTALEYFKKASSVNRPQVTNLDQFNEQQVFVITHSGFDFKPGRKFDDGSYAKTPAAYIKTDPTATTVTMSPAAQDAESIRRIYENGTYELIVGAARKSIIRGQGLKFLPLGHGTDVQVSAGIAGTPGTAFIAAGGVGSVSNGMNARENMYRLAQRVAVEANEPIVGNLAFDTAIPVVDRSTLTWVLYGRMLELR